MINSIKTKTRRVTLADVAREAGLSVPTVDRVLNGRAPVRADTARRVEAAAAALGYHAAGLVAQRVAALRPERRLGFLLQRRASEFYRNLGAELGRAVRNPQLGRHTPVIEHMEDLTPASVADRLLRLGERCDALAVVAADHPKVNAAVERLAAAGHPVYALLSDLGTDSRAGYFGIDHRKAGRTAAWALARLTRSGGDIAVVMGNHRYLGHELCEMSFRAYLREHAPGFRVHEPIASFEDRRFAYEATLDLLRRIPDIAGIYVPGGGIEGIVEALRERQEPHKVAVVAMDLFTETREALHEGLIDMVLATPVTAVAEGVVDAMLSRLESDGTGAQRATLPFAILVAENL